MDIASSGAQLEFDVLKDALSERVATVLGQREVAALTVLAKRDLAVERIEAIQQTRGLIMQNAMPSVAGAEDVENALGLGEKGLILDGMSLRAIARTLVVGAELRRQLFAHEDDAPYLYGLVASLTDLNRPAQFVLRCFEPSGHLADNASPELGILRKRVLSLKESIREKITEILRSPAMESRLTENYFTVRGDRYVLPIQSSFKNEVAGIVHDTSGSGHTVFIEPQAVIDLGNRLKIAQSETEEEEQRILAELTERLIEHAPMTRRIMSVLARVDLFNAAARFAEDFACVGIVPDLQPGFALKNARHPLLLLQSAAAKRAQQNDAATELRPFEVVGNDLELLPAQRVLVLTGPNTGGKTVALKTVGLLILMAQAGLHLPCHVDSRLGWFTAVHVAMGDQQSLAQRLSTFAAHMQELVRMCARAQAGSICFIDEITADTDPIQGQALAQAVLEALADQGAHVVVTSHFETLKALPFVDARFRNAGVGFDSVALRPTYQVSLDVPQSSSGFEIAQNLGLAKSIVMRARSLRGEASVALESLMRELKQKADEFAAHNKIAEEKLQTLEVERAQIKLRETQLLREIAAVREHAQRELLVEIENSREKVRALIAQLQGAADHPGVKDAMRQATKVQVELEDLAKNEAAKQPPPSTEKLAIAPKAGDWVFVPKLNQDGEVLSVDGRMAQILVGAVRLRVAVDHLARAKTAHSIKAEPPSRPQWVRPRLEREKSLAEVQVVQRTEEIDVRGFVVDEALARLDAFLDHHYQSPTTHVRVIHGMGSGALREALRGHFQGSGYVKSFRPGDANEGGDGVTLLTLA